MGFFSQFVDMTKPWNSRGYYLQLVKKILQIVKKELFTMRCICGMLLAR